MIKIMPSVCTAGNLLCGVFALAAAFGQDYRRCVAFILAAALLDRLDGLVARRYNVTSSFGREFDSLADLVSFGVAPAALVYRLLAATWSVPALACFGAFVLCGAFRLARFNVTPGGAYFRGLPITAGGSLLAVAVLVIPSPAVAILSTAALSLAMVSSARVPKI